MPGLTISGVIAAVVTPFRPDERIDYSAWQRTLESAVASGVSGILILGLPGEFTSLSEEERVVAGRFCRQTVAGRVPLWANVTAGSVRETLRLAMAAEADQMDALVLMPPPFPILNEEEMEEFAIELCRAVRTPVLVSVDPRWSPLRISGGVMRRLFGSCENFSGCLDGFPVDRGFDPQSTIPSGDLQIASAVRNGAAAVVSEFAGLAPRLAIELFKALREGRGEDARQLADLLEPAASQVAAHTYPSVLKLALDSAGLGSAVCRRPVGEIPEPLRSEIGRRFDAIWARVGRPGEVLSRA